MYNKHVSHNDYKPAPEMPKCLDILHIISRFEQSHQIVLMGPYFLREITYMTICLKIS